MPESPSTLQHAVDDSGSQASEVETDEFSQVEHNQPSVLDNHLLGIEQSATDQTQVDVDSVGSKSKDDLTIDQNLLIADSGNQLLSDQEQSTQADVVPDDSNQGESIDSIEAVVDGFAELVIEKDKDYDQSNDIAVPSLHLDEQHISESRQADVQADQNVGERETDHMSMEIKHIVEAALFASGAPMTVSQILKLFEDHERPERSEIRAALTILQQDYADKAVQLVEVGGGFRFQVKADYAAWITRLFEERPPKYSRALLETLAIIAYRQPVTRGEIENIRGVSVSTQIIQTLQEREWVKIVGHKEVPGKPALFATTTGFLDYFNLKSLTELPPLTELTIPEAIPDSQDEQLTTEQSDHESTDESQTNPISDDSQQG